MSKIKEKWFEDTWKLWHEFTESDFYRTRHGNIGNREEECQWGFRWFMVWLKDNKGEVK